MAGFLGLEDLTNSRGELALVVQTDKKNFSIEAVASLPDTSISSVQDAYLSASLSSVLPAFPRHKGQSEQHYKRQNPSVLELFVSSYSEKSTQLSPLTNPGRVLCLQALYFPILQHRGAHTHPMPILLYRGSTPQSLPVSFTALSDVSAISGLPRHHRDLGPRTDRADPSALGSDRRDSLSAIFR